MPWEFHYISKNKKNVLYRWYESFALMTKLHDEIYTVSVVHYCGFTFLISLSCATMLAKLPSYFGSLFASFPLKWHASSQDHGPGRQSWEQKVRPQQHTRSIKIPERTRRVLQPPFCPNRTSVSKRSPTMHIWDVVIPNLPPKKKKGKTSQNYSWTSAFASHILPCRVLEMDSWSWTIAGTVSLLLLCQVVHHECRRLPDDERFLFGWTKNSADHRPATWAKANVHDFSKGLWYVSFRSMYKEFFLAGI